MPLLLRQQKEDALLGIWRVTEDLPVLKSLLLTLDPDCIFPKIRNGERLVEWIVVRLLLNEMTGSLPVISHQEDGRPVLKNFPLKLSVSHTRGLLAVMISSRPAGVDVERLDRPVRRVAARFLSEAELTRCLSSQDPEKMMLLHWCTKEAVFKWTPEDRIDFQKQIEITRFSLADQSGTVSAVYRSHDSRTYSLRFKILIEDNYLLVYGPTEQKQKKAGLF